MARKKKYFRFILLYLFIVLPGANAGILQNNYKFEAIYIYSFTKYISWPYHAIGNQFVIGVYGYSPISMELSTATAGKQVGNKNIVVKVFNALEEIENCQVLFVTTEFENEIPELTVLANSKHILIVTQGQQMTQKGAGINLVKIDGKQKFELSETILKNAGLKISNQLLPLAILVK